MKSMIRKIRAFLKYPSISELSRSESVMRRAWELVRIYYLVLPVLAFQFFKQFPVPLTQQNFSPAWGVAWSTWLQMDPDLTVNIIRGFFLLVSLAAIMFFRHRLTRILVFIAIFQAQSFSSSFGSVNHQWYLWFYTSLIFIFLPKERKGDFESARTALLVVWWAQASVMLAYTSAGFWKFAIAFQQMAEGQMGGLSPHAFSYQVANWVSQLQSEAVLAPLIIAHPYLSWPFYVASHCFQFFALWTMVRPSLQRIWGFELVTFHIMTYLCMGISFDQFVPLLLVLFFLSPFSPESPTFKQVLYDLPILGQLLEWNASRRMLRQAQIAL